MDGFDDRNSFLDDTERSNRILGEEWIDEVGRRFKAIIE